MAGWCVSTRMSQSFVTARALPADTPADVARPFVWLAALSFAAGFWMYLALTPLLGR
jgi:hypothetical protein